MSAAGSGQENAAALARGMENLEKRLDSVKQFGLQPVVALNVRAGDTEAEQRFVLDGLKTHGVEAGLADVYGQGGAGARALAELIVANANAASPTPRFVYDLADAPEAIRRWFDARLVCVMRG